jgi:hypothetical protein
MIKVKFRNHGEIRMGSPYNLYSIKLDGEWVPDLPKDGWQNTHARSPGGRYLILTAWDTTDNKPGFYFILIDALKRSYLRTDVFRGCCTKLEWMEDGVFWEAWSIDGERSGKLPLPPT